MIPAALWLLASYLVGAIPTSYLAGTLFRGLDLREHGSKNLGATNVYRVLGWRYAVPVALIDIAKGAVPVLLFAPRVSSSTLFALLCGVMAVVGHVFSIFVRFRGGKGVATAAGAVLALTPLALGMAALLWAAVVFGTGYVSLASITAAVALAPLVWLLHPGRRELVWPDALLAAAIVWFHRANIRRLLHGTEHRFGRRGTRVDGGEAPGRPR